MYIFKRSLAITILAILASRGWLGEIAVAGAGQWVVVTAEQAGLQPGAVLEGGQILTLVEGARVTLLAESGKTLKLTGPYSGALGADPATDHSKNDLQVIAGLLQGHFQASSSIGALRVDSAETQQIAEGIQLDSMEQQVVGCITGDLAWLWRRHAVSTEAITLADAKGKPLAQFTWPAGEKRLAAPGHFFQNGQSYQIQRDGGTILLRMHKMQHLPNNPAAKAAWMTKQGCKSQALNLLRSL